MWELGLCLSVMAAVANSDPMLLQQPSQGLVLKEVNFTGGSAGASSFGDYRPPITPPELAFKQDAEDISLAWWSGRQKPEDPLEERGKWVRFPHLIWYQFEWPIVPGRVSFGPFQYAGSQDEFWFGATMWQFIGTNDDVCNEYSAWTILCEDLSGSNFKRATQNKYCGVENENFKSLKYKCLGISVLGSSNTKHPSVAISGIRMWERVD